jgi:hypothetical protein
VPEAGTSQLKYTPDLRPPDKIPEGHIYGPGIGFRACHSDGFFQKILIKHKICTFHAHIAYPQSVIKGMDGWTDERSACHEKWKSAPHSKPRWGGSRTLLIPIKGIVWWFAIRTGWLRVKLSHNGHSEKTQNDFATGIFTGNYRRCLCLLFRQGVLPSNHSEGFNPARWIIRLTGWVLSSESIGTNNRFVMKGTPVIRLSSSGTSESSWNSPSSDAL